MNTRYRLIYRGIRGGMYYCVDKTTGKRASLKTAILRETKLDGVDLSRAEGLGTALMPRGYTPPVPAKN